MKNEDLTRQIKRIKIFQKIFKVGQYLLLIKLTLHGRENIPKEGPMLIVSNHMSIIDTFAMGVALPALPSKLFVGEKWKNHFIGGPVFRSVGGIFIKRGQIDRAALKEAVDALDQGYIFGLAPEGRRIKTGHLAKGKDGASYLVSRANVPILPVGITNTDIWSSNYKRMRRTHVEISVGKPFTIPNLGRRVRSRDLAAYTHLIMVKIAENLPSRYYGYYADSPALTAVLRGEDPWPHCLEAEGVRG